jgi:hypothetical protein
VLVKKLHFAFKYGLLMVSLAGSGVDGIVLALAQEAAVRAARAGVHRTNQHEVWAANASSSSTVGPRPGHGRANPDTPSCPAALISSARTFSAARAARATIPCNGDTSAEVRHTNGTLRDGIQLTLWGLE